MAFFVVVVGTRSIPPALIKCIIYGLPHKDNSLTDEFLVEIHRAIIWILIKEGPQSSKLTDANL